MQSILIVDDEQDIRNSVKLCLRGEGYDFVEANNGREALTAVKNSVPALIILDCMMPVLDGLSALKEIRKSANGKFIPVIMLTALSDDLDIMKCFEAGADSYINKPFKFVHLQMQVKALLQRAAKPESPADRVVHTLVFHNLELKPAEFSAAIDGVPVELTPKEFDLLKFFLEQPNKLHSRDDILNHVWGYDFEETRTVDYHLSKLREKLAKCPEFVGALVNVRGRGYRLDAQR
ncbi:MAG: response regulator transcription factor [Negativicutes bacterium]|jgi:two-component system alkaline phosphatase synthesis response regulator PhoP